MFSTDLAEYHQEGKQHWYLGTRQCHGGSHLLCTCVCVYLSVRPSVAAAPGKTAAAVQILTHAQRRRRRRRGREGRRVGTHRNNFTDCVYDETVLIKHL